MLRIRQPRVVAHRERLARHREEHLRRVESTGTQLLGFYTSKQKQHAR